MIIDIMYPRTMKRGYLSARASTPFASGVRPATPPGARHTCTPLPHPQGFAGIHRHSRLANPAPPHQSHPIMESSGPKSARSQWSFRHVSDRLPPDQMRRWSGVAVK